MERVTSLLHLRSVLASASFRLTIACAGAFVLVVLIVFAVGGIATVLVLDRELKSQVEDEFADLKDVFATSGEAGLVRAIENRQRSVYTEGLSYRLSTFGNRLLAGKAFLPDFAETWTEFVPPGNDEDEVHASRAVRLSDDLWLAVAIDRESLKDSIDHLLTGAAWTLAIAPLLALLCGWMMSMMVLRRIDAVTRTTVRIREEGLQARVPLSGSGDEFDRLASNINAMLDSIEALTRNIEQVSAGVAHNLRSPLSRLRNTLERLRQETHEPKLLAVADGASEEVASILKTFDALLRIGQIDSGTRRAGFQPVDLSALVTDLVDTYEPVTSAAGKRLTAAIPPDIRIHGDAELLVQMIANLVENAVEHTPEHTNIAIGLAGQSQVSLTVADDGPGIPAEERRHVLERFYRLDRSLRSNGSGLGLSIVQAIAKLHGAQVILSDNRPGLHVEVRF
ncbi:Signal transduction histidine kinase [Candidatus Defluviicoccus seviourii]|uniref:histidine kinase n=1 Tax=Candidatus Defluviicoccus seviourii TaxID=2565273 RepID=A0A564W9R8_9PROT|nr:Signal transduction histidine kinase [Candidatus Defluviicoccus seviourii]